MSRMKALFLVVLLALPMNAEIRGGLRGGAYQGLAVGTVELEARHGDWSLAPALDVIRGGYDLHAIHIDARRLFRTARSTAWIGVGPTFVSSNTSSHQTWNVDAGIALRTKRAWEPYIAARYYTYRLPVFRDEIVGRGG